MSKGKVRVLVVAAVFIILALPPTLFSDPHVEGWHAFKKSTIRKYSFIRDVNLVRMTPPDFHINYTLNRNIDLEEAKKVFLDTKNYIFTEKVFEDLKKYHSKKYKYSFCTINIEFSYWDNGKINRWKFFSSSGVDGEPSYDSFNTWYIEYNNEPSQIYNPN